MARDTLHIALDAAVTKTASFAPPARDYNLDRFNELVITLNITAAERTTTQTYDFYVITGDGSSEWDLVHFPQIAVAGATKLTARVLSSLLPQTVTPAAPGVAAIAPGIINTLTTNAPKTLGAGQVAHGPWGNYLRYELVCAGTITTGISYTVQVEAAWGTGRAVSNAVQSSGGGGSVNFDFTSGLLPPEITFTRSSTGTYFNNAGVLITASANAARFNYVSGVACLLVEPAATNILPNSNAFLSGGWSVENAAVLTAAQFTSPDGTNNGWNDTSGTGFGQVVQQVTVGAGPYTCSAWIKQIAGGGSGWLAIGNQFSAALPITATIARKSYTGTPGAGSQKFGVNGGNPAGVTLGLFGCQVEAGSVGTSYIPTGATAVTRAADAATFTIPAGVTQLTFTFDDNSTQLVSVSPGSYTIPVTLNRANIKTIIGT